MRRNSQLAIGLLLCFGVSAGHAQSVELASRAPVPPLSSVDSARHVLSRLAFGPRPGEVDRVRALGVRKWIDRQLKPEAIPDNGLARALKDCNSWTDPLPGVLAILNGPISTTMNSPTNGMRRIMVFTPGLGGLVTRDSLRRLDSARTAFGAGIYRENAQLVGCRLTRAEFSEQQLLEVMTDFWENHFSLSGNYVVTRGALVYFDREVVRPRALGRFRDLLGAVAHSPAMLAYLDNAVSILDSGRTPFSRGQSPLVQSQSTLARRNPLPTGLNENFAREMLELHTLGVDGGYTQTDVIEVARAFTGWTHTWSALDGRPPGIGGSSRDLPLEFIFDPTRHDADAKIVLGKSLPAGRGVEDGEDVLDLVARHPSTARHIARKLAVRLVSDDPPASIVDRAAETFRKTDGDIREVVRTIVTSPEFFAPEVYGAKVKSPLEFAQSLRRVMGAPVDTAAEVIDFLVDLRQPPFGRISPDGWPETGQAWMTVGSMRIRLDIAGRIAAGKIPSIPVTGLPGWKRLVDAPFERQVEGVMKSLLGDRVSEGTRAAMLSVGEKREGGGNREDALRALVAIALGSPEFQRR